MNTLEFLELLDEHDRLVVLSCAVESLNDRDMREKLDINDVYASGLALAVSDYLDMKRHIEGIRHE